MNNGKLSVDQISSLIGLPSSDKRADVEAQIDKYLGIAEAHFKRGFNRPAIAYDLKGHVGGTATGGHLIRINFDILNDPRYYEDMIQQTVPHELAHIIVHQIWPDAGAHGAHWQMVMALFGKPATRCHQYETRAAKKHKKFHYTCFCEGEIHKFGVARHSRAQSGSRWYLCKICNGKLFWNGETSQ